MTDENEFTPEDQPEEGISIPPGEEKFVEMKEEFDETLADPALESPEIPHHPAANLSDMVEEPPASEEELAEVKEPTRFQIFMRRVLIWFAVIFTLFAAGFATFYFVLYQPRVAEKEAEINDLQSQIVDLEAEIEDLDAEIGDLGSEIASLNTKTAALEDAEKHTALLMVMVDAYEARYAIGEENVVAAKSALSGTNSTLDEIIEDIRSFDSGLADTLPQRIELIRTNLDRDLETATEDCDQLIEDLLAVETALFP